MPLVSRNVVLRGFFFVVSIFVNLMCERWMMKLKITGNPSYKPHVFNHVFLLWFFKQCLLALMYLLWKAIDKNWLGMSFLQHAQVEEAEPAGGRGIQPRLRRGKNTYSALLFLLPSVFSQAHVLLVFFGLRLTYDSSIIMLKGTASSFVTLLSLAFLAKQISTFAWVGVAFSTVGFALSGLSDYIHLKPPGYDRYGIAAGDLLFTMGQITMTTQMVYEEKYIRKNSIHPMQFLGSEGLYSVVFSIIMLLSFQFSSTQYSDLPNNRIEDIPDAVLQMTNSTSASLATVGTIFSYVIYTYLGMILIRDHGAMARIMIETLAWGPYWLILVLIGWEHYYITQIPGLLMIPVGVLIFSRILGCPCWNNDVIDPQGEAVADILEDVVGDERNNQPVQINGHVHENDDEVLLDNDDDDQAPLLVGRDEPMIQ